MTLDITSNECFSEELSNNQYFNILYILISFICGFGIIFVLDCLNKKEKEKTIFDEVR